MLMRGARGDNVKLIQEVLTDAGVYDGKIDGLFGRKTDAAVKHWQTWNGLVVDGMWGPKTTNQTGRVLDQFGTVPLVNNPHPHEAPADPAWGGPDGP